MSFYYLDGQNQQQGPITVEEINGLLENGVLTPATLVWEEGMPTWQPLSEKWGLRPEKRIDSASSAEPDRRDFEYSIECRPDFSFLRVQIPAGKMLKVEASAMATMDTNLVMKTKMKGGLGRLLTGESLFLNEFTAENAGGEIGIAPGPPGDLEHVYVEGAPLYLQNSAFVASGPGVIAETKWQGLTKGFFSGESLFLIRCSGQGDLWFSTYGAMFCIEVDGQYVVDTGHIVAFTDGLQYEVGRIGGYKSLFLSGEGLVCRFRGQGKVWIQTRKVSPFSWWVYPFRPVKSSN